MRPLLLTLCGLVLIACSTTRAPVATGLPNQAAAIAAAVIEQVPDQAPAIVAAAIAAAPHQAAEITRAAVSTAPAQMGAITDAAVRTAPRQAWAIRQAAAAAMEPAEGMPLPGRVTRPERVPAPEGRSDLMRRFVNGDRMVLFPDIP